MLARMLKIRARDPVLSIESIGRNSADQVVEYFQAWHRADRTRLEMDVVRSPRPHAAPVN
jgi:GntR family transcriptional regulator